MFLESHTRVHGTAFDNEPGWASIGDALAEHSASDMRSCSSTSCPPDLSFLMELGDVTLSLEHPSNAKLLQLADEGVDLYVFSYVIHEVEGALRNPGAPVAEGLGGVLPGLFRSCARLATTPHFLFLDSTPRLWPAVAATGQAYGFASHLPTTLKAQSKPQEPLLLTRLADNLDMQSDAESKRVSQRFSQFERYLIASDKSRILRHSDRPCETDCCSGDASGSLT